MVADMLEGQADAMAEIRGHTKESLRGRRPISEINTIPIGGHARKSPPAAYVLTDYKLALNAGWDDAMLAPEIADLQAVGTYDLTQLTDAELERLIRSRA